MPRRKTFCTVTLFTERLSNFLLGVWSVMMPFRASMFAPPMGMPVVRFGLSPSTVRLLIVTLLAWTRMTLDVRPGAGQMDPPLGQSFGFEIAGTIFVTPVVDPCSLSGLVTTTFSLYVPALTAMVSLATAAVMAFWIVLKLHPTGHTVRVAASALPARKLTATVTATARMVFRYSTAALLGAASGGRDCLMKLTWGPVRSPSPRALGPGVGSGPPREELFMR